MWAKGTYSGELNEEGQAHGKGTFTTIYKVVYSGTFFENKMQGLGIRTKTDDDDMQIGQMKDSVWNGIVTEQKADGDAFNYIYEDGCLKLGSRKKVKKEEDVWFESDLLRLCANIHKPPSSDKFVLKKRKLEEKQKKCEIF